jgi:hypothetical protein
MASVNLGSSQYSPWFKPYLRQILFYLNRHETADTAYDLQETPIAKTGDATLTIAELLTGLITATKATAVAFTLPTGTLTDAGLGTLVPVNSSIDWAVINLGSATGAVTLNAGAGHTIVGNAVVAISTTARFRTRKTAANTFVTYRL